MNSVTKDYQLRELVGNHGAFSYKAVHLSSRQDCMVHILSGEPATIEAVRQDLMAFRDAGEPLTILRDSGFDVVVTPPIENFVSFQVTLADMRRVRQRNGLPQELRTGPIGKELLRILEGTPPPETVGALPAPPSPVIADLNSGLIRKEIVQFSASGRQIISRTPLAPESAPAAMPSPTSAPAPVAPKAPINLSPMPAYTPAPAFTPAPSYSPAPAYLPAPAPQEPSPEAVALHWKTQELAQMRVLAISGWSVAAVLTVVLLAALLSKWS